MNSKVTLKNKKRIVIGFLLLTAVMLIVTFRVGWHQIVKADELTARAIEQQTMDVPVSAKRGSIYDRNGKELASSLTCYTLWARPAEIADGRKDSEIEDIAEDIAELTGEKASAVKKAVTTKQALISVAKYIDKETADEIRTYLSEEDVAGFHLSEDNRRYYPLGNFASQLLGSVTIDNTGRTGIELEYDQYLSGVEGRWSRNVDVNDNEIVDGTEKYYEAQDGLNVVLTLDEAIQYYVEKALEKGMKETKADRIMCLVMDPDTGEILANATTPGFDPNNATEPDSSSELKKFNKLSTDEQMAYLYKMWRNPIVSDTYEPGSTFKLLTSSSALEEGAIDLNDTFNCGTSINVSGINLHCWSTVDHGVQTVKEAVGNSCNPAHAKIATIMGKEVFYKYLDLYGITEKTGIDYPGETGSIMYKLEDVGPVELATMGYGQSVSVTPIQLLTAVNAIGNGGNLLQPRYVKALTDSDGNVVEEYETEVIRRVLSEETAAEMREIMEYVVAEGGGGSANITGYRIGGKTGTANKIDVGSGAYGDYYYSSFLGMAPMDDPEVSILVVVDSPKGAYYGSIVAAPIAKDILEDVLRYLNVEPEYTEEELKEIEGNYTKVPDVTGTDYSEAVGMIAGKELKCEKPDGSSDSFKVVDQYPKAGTKVKRGSKVYVYSD